MVLSHLKNTSSTQNFPKKWKKSKQIPKHAMSYHKTPNRGKHHNKTTAQCPYAYRHKKSSNISKPNLPKGHYIFDKVGLIPG